MYEELIKRLREYAEWAAANEWESPIALGDHLTDAADTIEKLAAEVERLHKENFWLSGGGGE